MKGSTRTKSIKTHISECATLNALKTSEGKKVTHSLICAFMLFFVCKTSKKKKKIACLTFYAFYALYAFYAHKKFLSENRLFAFMLFMHVKTSE